MSKARYYLMPLLILFLGVGTASAAYIKADSTNNSTVSVNNPVTDDVYLAGTNLSLKAPVSGELFAAGRDVVVEQKIERSIFVAANDITIKKGSGYNVYAAGTTVTLNGEYDRDLFIAATNINFADDVVIKGDVRLAGEKINLAGKIGGNVYAYTSTMTSKAEIAGNLEGTYSQLTFTGGSIAGDLKYSSPKSFAGLNEVRIEGKTDRTEIADNASNSSGPLNNSFGLFIFSVISFMILGALLIGFFPKKSEDVVSTMWSSYLHSWVKGFLITLLAPSLIVLAFITGVGWRLGVLEIALYGVLLMAAVVYGRVFLGRLVLRTLQSKNSQALFLELLLGVLIMDLFGATSAIVLFGTIVLFGITFFLPALGSILTIGRSNLD